jgi:hypothetical protein
MNNEVNKLNLELLEKQLDEALSKETNQTLTEWLIKRREANNN